MDIYDFLNTFTDLGDVRVTVWDLNHELELYDSDNDDDYATIGRVPYDLACNEVSSVDLFKDTNGRICLELNIEREDDEDD